MFETGIRQARMAMSMVTGRPINVRNLERLVGDARQTLEKLGAPGDDVEQVLDGPFADPKTRESFQNAALRRTARRLASVSSYYRRLFDAHGVAPQELRVGDMRSIPVTVKQDLIEQPADFIASDTTPFISTRTTGTTGRPAEIWLSRYEIELWPAMSALSGLLRGEIGPDDCMQINISSRATAAVQLGVSLAALVGARSRVLGVVAADESIDSLLTGGDTAPTFVNTYPSYLAALVRAARRRGLRPEEFRLRRVVCGGEVLSPALAAAAVDTFGLERVVDNFGMTEVLPVSGRVCAHGHTHHDLNMGFVEVVDLDGEQEAAPGELGTVVITPYFPYRECMPVFRYDTRDVVRRLPDDNLTCDLAGTPATSHILGKADQVLQVGQERVTPRQLIEVIEAMPSQPWPARFASSVVDGALRLVISDADLDTAAKAELRERFRDLGIDVEVPSGIAESGEQLRPVRADLVETTFSGRSV